MVSKIRISLGIGLSLIILFFNLGLQEAPSESIVPSDDIIRQLPPDVISSIDSPKFLSIEEFEEKYTPSELNDYFILGFVYNGDARAYPRNILDWHEIVNDQFQNTSISITYCPLTGSGVAYDTNSIKNSTCGTSGNLYENNLVLYDRDSGTYWSQMYNRAIRGERIGEYLEILPLIETSWPVWKKLYPNTTILSAETGVYNKLKEFDLSLYDKYRGTPHIWFKTSFDPKKPPYNLYSPKMLTLIINDIFITGKNPNVQLFPYDELAKNIVVNGFSNSLKYTIFYDTESKLAIPFNVTVPEDLGNFTYLTFNFFDGEGISNEDKLFLPVFRDDQTGTIWNMKGEPINGSLVGKMKISRIPSYYSFWFAATVFFPDAEIFVENTLIKFDSVVNPQNFDPIDHKYALDIDPMDYLSGMMIIQLFMRRRRK